MPEENEIETRNSSLNIWTNELILLLYFRYTILP